MNHKNRVLSPILNVLAELHSKGRNDSYLYSIENQLKHLAKHTDLNNPKQVTEFIASKQKSESYKFSLCNAYNLYCLHYKIEWTKPSYIPAEKMPKLPTEQQLNRFITASGKTLSLKLWISKESGLRPIELHGLLVRDVDISHNALNPTTAKHGSARTIKIPPNLTQAIEAYIIRNNSRINDKLFKSDARHYGNAFRDMRKRLAKKLNDPSLLTVRLYDFRHWFATMRYWKYRDIPLTAYDMGHKDWNTTQKYVHLLKIIELTEEDGWVVKTANTTEEDKLLLQQGFEYITERNGTKLYRKRK